MITSSFNMKDFKKYTLEDFLEVVNKLKINFEANSDNSNNNNVYKRVIGDWSTDVKYQVQYFVEYYPKNKFGNDYNANQQNVYDFKDGLKTQEFSKKFIFFIKNFLIHENIKEWVLVPIPASSSYRTEKRYKKLLETICKETGLQNGFDYIKNKADSTPGHYSKSLKQPECSFIAITKKIKNQKILLLDDVITSGETFFKVIRTLYELEATEIKGIALASTYGKNTKKEDFLFSKHIKDYKTLPILNNGIFLWGKYKLNKVFENTDEYYFEIENSSKKIVLKKKWILEVAEDTATSYQKTSINRSKYKWFEEEKENIINEYKSGYSFEKIGLIHGRIPRSIKFLLDNISLFN